MRITLTFEDLDNGKLKVTLEPKAETIVRKAQALGSLTGAEQAALSIAKRLVEEERQMRATDKGKLWTPDRGAN